MTSSNPFRLRRTLAILLAQAVGTAAFGASAAPIDMPPLRAGLWEATTVGSRAEPRAPAVTRMCIDKQTQRHVLDQLALAMPKMCSRSQHGMRGGRFVTDSSCTFGASTIEGTTETTFQRDTAYRMEVVGRVGPSGRIVETRKAVIDGRHVGACPVGMKPGDLVLPNGLRFNLVELGRSLPR